MDPEPDGVAGFDRKMTREEISACPVIAYEGPVEVVRTEAEAREAARRMAAEPVLGFDTESRPTWRKGQFFPPTLLQLAGEDAVCLFQLARTGMPAELLHLLSSATTRKVGVALARDVAELRDLRDFQPAGFLDLGDAARAAGLHNHGLRGLAAVLLGRRISKGAQRSNWAVEELTEKQIRYAATDAWIGLRLFQEMKTRHLV